MVGFNPTTYARRLDGPIKSGHDNLVTRADNALEPFGVRLTESPITPAWIVALRRGRRGFRRCEGFNQPADAG